VAEKQLAPVKKYAIQNMVNIFINKVFLLEAALGSCEHCMHVQEET
jgi:hypothetical protein